MRVALAALIAALLLAVVPPASSAATVRDERVELVRKLYKAFSLENRRLPEWLFLDPRYSFVAMPQARLESFLTPSLAMLIAREQHCRQQTRRRYCKLDFEPLWDAEAPSGARINIKGLADDGTVRVRIWYGGRKSVIMTFVMRHTDAGWRIDDFGTAAWSLRQLLSPPVSTNQNEPLASTTERP